MIRMWGLWQLLSGLTGRFCVQAEVSATLQRLKREREEATHLRKRLSQLAEQQSAINDVLRASSSRLFDLDLEV